MDIYASRSTLRARTGAGFSDVRAGKKYAWRGTWKSLAWTSLSPVSYRSRGDLEGVRAVTANPQLTVAALARRGARRYRLWLSTALRCAHPRPAHGPRDF